MRTWQGIGLSDRAIAMLDELEAKGRVKVGMRYVTETYFNPDRREVKKTEEIWENKVEEKVIEVIEVWYGTGPEKIEYWLNGILVYTEDLQSTMYSSGPMTFMALKDKDGNWIEESLWSTEEMDKYC